MQAGARDHHLANSLKNNAQEIRIYSMPEEKSQQYKPNRQNRSATSTFPFLLPFWGEREEFAQSSGLSNDASGSGQCQSNCLFFRLKLFLPQQTPRFFPGFKQVKYSFEGNWYFVSKISFDFLGEIYRILSKSYLI